MARTRGKRRVRGAETPPVPPLALSDTLLFAGPDCRTLHDLANDDSTGIWQHAIVLATPFWDTLSNHLGGEPVDLNNEISALVAASIRFDPDRDVCVSSRDFDPGKVSFTTRCIIQAARSVRFRDAYPCKVLPEMIGLLPNLTSLIIENSELYSSCCRGLVASLSSLASLRTLSLWSCGEVEDISALASLTGLQSLEIEKCWMLKDISPLASLVSLESLTIDRALELEDVSPLSHLTSLRVLRISAWSISDVTPLAALSALEILDLDGCLGLNDVSPISSLATLQILDLRQTGVEAVPSLPSASFLHTMALRNSSVRDLSALESFHALRRLDLSDCSELVNIAPVAALGNILEEVSIEGCNSLVDISALGSLVLVKSLVINSHGVHDISSLASMTSLRSLVLHGLRLLTDVSALAFLPVLQTVKITCCQVLADVSPLSSVASLQALHLSGCEVMDISALGSLRSVVTLDTDICRCDQVSEIPTLTAPALQSLDLSGSDVTRLDVSLWSTPRIRWINMDGCQGLVTVVGLGSLTTLETLNFDNCCVLTEIPALGEMPLLRSLSLKYCRRLMSVSALSSLVALQELNLCNCRELSAIHPLASLTTLTKLDLSGIGSLADEPTVDVSLLASMTSLRNLAVCGCRLSSVSELSKLKRLESLDLSFCRNLKTVRALGPLRSLRELQLNRCLGLSRASLRPLAKLTSLQRLDLRNIGVGLNLNALEGLTNTKILTGVDDDA